MTTAKKTYTPPEWLAPTQITTIIQCPLKFKFHKLDGLTPDKSDALVRGIFVHEIIEKVMALPPDARDIEQARTIARVLWNEQYEKDASELIDGDVALRQFQWSAWWCVENYFGLEDPTTIKPAGMESWVRGKIGGVKVRGVIDRWDKQPDSNVAEIVDYKTGKTPKKKEWASDYILQLSIYGMLLEKEKKVEVEKLRIFFLKEGDIMEFDLSESRRKSTTNTVTKVSNELMASCATGEFEARTSKLCDWCSFKNICPAWQ